MSNSRSIENLSADEIRVALATAMSDEETEAIQEFVDKVGGIDNAILAVEMLYDLEDAA